MKKAAPAPDKPVMSSGRDRSDAARRAAATRRENEVLSASACGRLLLALRGCQAASDQAKSRAANNTRYSEYRDRSKYRWLNYGASRHARQRNYEAKRKAIDEACQAAAESGVVFGWAPSGSSHVPWIVYFELPSGQVSFHSDGRGEGPDYGGSWDGVKDAGAARIQASIDGLLAGSLPPPAPSQSILDWHRERKAQEAAQAADIAPCCPAPRRRESARADRAGWAAPASLLAFSSRSRILDMVSAIHD